jgi:hypothetical protein
MNLLDGLFSGGGGGLLDFLRQNAMNQQFGSGPQSDQAQYGAPMGAMAQMQPQMPNVSQPPQQMPFQQQAPQPAMAPQPMPQQQPMPQSMPQEAAPGGFGAGLNGFLSNLHTGPIGAIIGGVGSAAGLTDGKTAGLRQQANMTANYLRKVGAPEEAISAAVGNGRVPGNPEVLKTLLTKYANQEKIRPATAEERKAYGAAEDLPMGIDTTTNKPVYGPAGQKTNVSLSTVANPILKGVGDQIVAQRETAQTAARQTIPFVHQARQALDEGAITGQFADQKIFAQKVAGLFGLPTDSASNTEVFRGAIGEQVLAQIKSLGANPSNTDRDYIEKIKGGQVTLEEKSLRKLLDITEKYARLSIRNFNTDADKLISTKPDSYKDIAPLMRFDEPGEYKFTPPAKKAAATPPPIDRAAIEAELRRRGKIK